MTSLEKYAMKQFLTSELIELVKVAGIPGWAAVKGMGEAAVAKGATLMGAARKSGVTAMRFAKSQPGAAAMIGGAGVVGGALAHKAFGSRQ